jgi:hypothetical protein
VVIDRSLPGADLIDAGIADLRAGRGTVAALLISIGAPRLERLGLDLPPSFARPEHRLYSLLSETGVDSAHARYNALLRRLVSFERALACAK